MVLQLLIRIRAYGWGLIRDAKKILFVLHEQSLRVEHHQILLPCKNVAPQNLSVPLCSCSNNEVVLCFI